MNYQFCKATNVDIQKLIEYKLINILEYAKDPSDQELKRIQDYVQKMVPVQLKKYKMILVANEKVGCFLIENCEDGVLLDEIYLEEAYRNQGIGKDIIQNILLTNAKVYLWVYKLNKGAISLYQRLGFEVLKETENRYYMKCEKRICEV